MQQFYLYFIVPVKVENNGSVNRSTLVYCSAWIEKREDPTQLSSFDEISINALWKINERSEAKVCTWLLNQQSIREWIWNECRKFSF